MAVIKYRDDTLASEFQVFATKITETLPFTNLNTFTVEDPSQIQKGQRVTHPQAQQPQTFVDSVNKDTKTVVLTRNISADVGQEDILFESEFTTNSVLSNTEIDSNFKSLNDRKFEIDGSTPIDGDLTVNGTILADEIEASTINITGNILDEDSFNESDDPESIDSLIGVKGVFENFDSTPGATNRVSNRIFVEDSSVQTNFREGDVIRIYGSGASVDNQLNVVPVSPELEQVGFATTGETQKTFQYQVAVFNLLTGEYSRASNSTTINIAVPEDLLAQSNDVLQLFNVERFIRINNLSSIATSGQGVLVYRKAPEETNFSLVEVLGGKEVSEGKWIDYYKFDFNEWSGKKSFNNSFNEDTLIHFPYNPPSSSGRGWVDQQIAEIESNSESGFSIVLKESVIINDTVSPPTCQIAHNDTSLLQTAINANTSVGFIVARNFLILSFKSKKSLVLNAKKFVCSQLELPNNFSLNGSPGITEIQKLPWSSSGETEVSQNIIRTKEINPERVIITGVRFNGNVSSQFLLTEGTTLPDINYAVNFQNSSKNCRFTNCELINVIGGGIYAQNSENLEINNSRVYNSGRSDRFEFSPLTAVSSQNLFVQESRFQNFTDFIDVSIANRGVFVNNIVENCGTGVFVYGSKFFIANPNILIGPAGEFLPNADTLNSEYDAANIVINDINSDFTSPTFRYQENNENFDLTQTFASENFRGISEIIYQAQLLEKDSETGQESIWNNSPDITLVDVPNTERSEGVFQFRIPQETVEKIKLVGGEYSLKTLRETNSNHIGIVWSASYRYELFSGNILDFAVWSGNTLTVKIENLQNISVGSNVTIRDSINWSSGGITVGTVTNISDVINEPLNKNVQIEFAGANNVSNGQGGQINIVDRFIMAQGRIL